MIKNNIKLLLNLILFSTYSSYLFSAYQQSLHNNQSPLHAFIRTIDMQRIIAQQQAATVLATLQFPMSNHTKEIHEQSSTHQFNDITAIFKNTKKSMPAKRKRFSNDDDDDDRNNFSNDNRTNDDNYENADDKSFTPKRSKNVSTAHAIDEFTGKKVFKCSWENCKYQYNCLSKLTRHIRIHTGDKPYKCTHKRCTYIAARKDQLTMHMRIHTSEKPFKCKYPECNYASASSCALKSHIYIHTGKKPFKCNYEKCNFASAYSSSLAIHMRIHTNDKLFKCTYPGCIYASAYSSNLKSHIKKNHKSLYLQMQENKIANNINSITKMDGL